MNSLPEYHIAGDSAIFIKIGEEISETTNSDIRYLCTQLENTKLKGLIEWVSSYTGITVYYNPLVLKLDKLKESVSHLWKNKHDNTKSEKKIIHIPVCYHSNYAPDINNVAKHNNIEVEEVIKIHSSRDYRIYMLGFTPGFPYLGGMDKTISTPRKEEPRTFISAGSVGIAGEQTGIYSVDSPGGWQIIGKTPLILFNKNNHEPFLLKAGMVVRFFSVSEEEFQEIKEKVVNNSYSPKISTQDE